MVENMGLQLYTLRGETENGFASPLKKVADMGIRYVEFAGFGDMSTEETSSLLSSNGLKVIGAHVALDLLENDFDGTVAFHKAIGNDKIIIPWYMTDTEEAMNALLDTINTLQPKLQAQGLTLGYHNHDQEFKIFGGKTVLEHILDRTDAFLELDTFWAYHAGYDPVAFIRAHRDRIPLIHLKDGRNGHPLSIGSGDAPCQAVYDCAVELGVDAIIIENDNPEPDGITDVQRSVSYIKDTF